MFKEMREPFKQNTHDNIIDFNWQVDSILKNFQPYTTKAMNQVADKGEQRRTAIRLYPEDIPELQVQ